MKNRLILLLLLLPSLLAAPRGFAQTTGRAWWPIAWPDNPTNALYGRVDRNYATYPTPGSDNAFFADIRSRTLPFVPRVGPSWAALQVTYVASRQTLEVEGAIPANVQMKFERVDGAALVGSNPDLVPLQSGIYYPNGSTGRSDYAKLWVFGKTQAGTGGIPAVPIRLTLKNLDNNQTYAHVFTPLNRASRAQLFVAAGSSPPPTSTTTGSGGSGPQPVATSYYADGFGEGSLAQLMQSAPFTPDFNNPSSNQYGSLPGGNVTMYIENAQVKFGIGKAIGGAIKHFSSKTNGKNWINTNADGMQGVFDGQPAPDPGRSGGWSMYGTPGRNFQENGMSTSAYYDTGMNWVHGGSAYRDYSQITWYEKRTVAGYGEVMYCRTVPRQWAIRNAYGQGVYHCWYWLNDHAAGYYTIIENNRNDNQMVYEGRQQEGPFVFPTADLHHHVIPLPTGDYDIPMANPVEGSVSQGTIWTPIYNASANYFAALNDAGEGIVIMPRHNYRFQGNQSQALDGDENSNATSYLNSAMMMNFDVQATTAFSGYIWAGNFNAFKNWYTTNNFSTRKFGWTFGQNNTCGWWSQNGPAKFINNRYSFNIGYGRPGDPGTPLEGQTVHFASFASPMGLWNASDIPTIYIKGTWPGNITNLRLSWKKPGNDNNSEYSKTFTVSSSTSEQTIAIPMAGTADWTEKISGIRFQMDNSFQAVGGNEQFIPTYIGPVNPN